MKEHYKHLNRIKEKKNLQSLKDKSLRDTKKKSKKKKIGEKVNKRQKKGFGEKWWKGYKVNTSSRKKAPLCFDDQSLVSCPRLIVNSSIFSKYRKRFFIFQKFWMKSVFETGFMVCISKKTFKVKNLDNFFS